MKFKVILERNFNQPCEFATFFRTKKEAEQYAKQFNDSIIKKKIGCKWVVCA
jgi:hypothetical protein